MHTPAVLVLGSGSPVGGGVVQSLLESRWKFVVHTADASPWAVTQRRPDHDHHLPRVKDPDYVTSLVRLCRKYDIEGIFVCSSAELLYTSAQRERLEGQTGARVFVSHRSLIDSMRDKWEMHEWLQEHGFPTIPAVRIPASTGEARAFSQYVGFPLVAKLLRGSGSEGMQLIEDSSQLDKLLGAWTVPGLLQQYVTGPEFTAGVTRAKDGVVTSSIVLRRRLKYGVTWYARARHFPAQREFSEKLVNKLGAYGPCNVQFRCHEGQPVVFDINVRWSSSTRIRTLCGINEPARLAAYELCHVDLPPAVPREVDIVRTWSHAVLAPDEARPDP